MRHEVSSWNWQKSHNKTAIKKQEQLEKYREEEYLSYLPLNLDHVNVNIKSSETICQPKVPGQGSSESLFPKLELGCGNAGSIATRC